ncbi:MAG: hypothetical protein R3B84_18795 [Zavarzinella sp.]
MNPGADVRSIDVLHDWYQQMSKYQVEFREILTAVALEIRRAYHWIDEKSAHWRKQIQKLEDEVYRAKMELRQRQTPNFDGRIPDTSVQEENLRRAKYAVEHARDQLEICQRWHGKLPKLIEEAYDGHARHLSNFLDDNMNKALTTISVRIEALRAYLQTIAPPVGE